MNKVFIEKLERLVYALAELLGECKEDYRQSTDTSRLKVITFPTQPQTNNLVQFNTKMLQSKEKEQEELKYRNITIKQHTTCSTWYCRYRDENGKQIYLSAKTQKDCYNKLKKALAGKQEPQNKQTYTFEQWKDVWLHTYKINNIRPATLSSYKSMDKYIQNLYKLNITKIQVIDILTTLNNIEFSRRKQQVYEYLKDIFTRAYENQIVKNNIFINIQKPKHQKISEKRAFTSEEEKKFIQSCKTHKDGDLFLICLFQGLRIGECLALKPNDINLEDMTLKIDESENRGNNLTKNKSSNRIMPIFEKTLPILQKYTNLPKDNKIFTKGKSFYEKIIKTIEQTAQVRDLTPHELRHTFITRCKELNIIEPVIQKWVGHTIGSKVTSKTYTHVNNEQIIKYIDIFNKTSRN